MQYLLDTPGPEGGTMSDETISKYLGAVMWASLITTSQLLASSLFSLAALPDVTSKVLEEQIQIKDKEEVSHDSIAKMEYLDATIKEILRFNSVGLGSMRMAMSDMTLGEYKIPKGSILTAVPRIQHFDSDNWPDPMKFDPTRFIDAKKQNIYSYIPFGLGAHACPGRFFAVYETKVLLRMILLNFNISLPSTVDREQFFHHHVTTLKDVTLTISKKKN